MPKPLKKDTFIKNSLRRPSSNNDAFRDLTIVLRKKFNDIESFQHQQKITMYIIMQFAMFLASATQSRDTIMEFYDDAYKGAIEKFGKEE